LFAFSRGNAQKVSKLQLDFVNTLLSDTAAIPHNSYFIPLKIKQKHKDTIMIYRTQTQFLYRYFNKEFGWNGNTFMDSMRPYLLYDKVFEVEDDGFLYKNNLMPACECDKLYNENAEELIQRIKKMDYSSVRNSQFSCLIYKCFKEQLIVIYEGENIAVSKFPFNLR